MNDTARKHFIQAEKNLNERLWVDGFPAVMAGKPPIMRWDLERILDGYRKVINPNYASLTWDNDNSVSIDGIQATNAELQSILDTFDEFMKGLNK